MQALIYPDILPKTWSKLDDKVMENPKIKVMTSIKLMEASILNIQFTSGNF